MIFMDYACNNASPLRACAAHSSAKLIANIQLNLSVSFHTFYQWLS